MVDRTRGRRPSNRWNLLAVAGLVLGMAAGPAFAADRLNVLFVVSDDLSARLGCFGHPVVKTPHIDRLAQAGVRFDHAYCQFPLCNPSRASFLTGLRPDNTGVLENATHFRKKNPDHVTLPQAFQQAGYRVARVGKLYHYGVPAQIGTDGLDDEPSWQERVNPRGRDKDDEEKIFSLNPTAEGAGRFGGTLSWLAADGTDAEQTDGKIAAAAGQLLERYAAEPFFLAVGFFRPHTPYVAPKPWFEMYPPGQVDFPGPPHDRTGFPAPAFGSQKAEQDRMTDAMRRDAIQAYYASISFMDAQVGQLLSTLDRLKLRERTIVVFFSDHGYHLYEHGLWQKMSLFENSARVPLVISVPGAAQAGALCQRPVELVDLYPTLAELCGIQPKVKLDGRSLVPLLSQPAAEWSKPAVTMVVRNPGAAGKKAQARMVTGRSLRTQRYRLTEWNHGEDGIELYDYDTDPRELKNLATDPAQAGVVKELRAKLQAHLQVASPRARSVSE